MIQTRYNKFLCLVCLTVLLLCSFIPLISPMVVYADTKQYSNALSDLKLDDNFNPDYYVQNINDPSLHVIQLAESVDNELFVYVYQPSAQSKSLTACSINISLEVGDDIKYYNYKLELLNSSGVFFKYLVKDLVVSNAPTRYYSITSIYRSFDKSIDSVSGNGNTITEVNYPVNKEYCFSLLNGKPYCTVKDIEWIEITEKFVGYVNYEGGFRLLSTESCSSHFVAFDTDRPIDKLYEADVYYVQQHCFFVYSASNGFQSRYDKPESKYAYLSFTDEPVEYTGSGKRAVTYRWDRIETTEQFLKEVSSKTVYSGAFVDVSYGTPLTEEAKKALKSTKWVLRFAETSYKVSYAGIDGASSTDLTTVGEVTILRLKFETDGIVYNLGVIDNKQSGSNMPVNGSEINVGVSEKVKDWADSVSAGFEDFLDKIEGFFDNVVDFFTKLFASKWFWIGLVVVVVLILLPILGFIIPSFGRFLIAVLKGLWWLISLPFKGIKALITKIKERKG